MVIIQVEQLLKPFNHNESTSNLYVINLFKRHDDNANLLRTIRLDDNNFSSQSHKEDSLLYIHI